MDGVEIVKNLSKATGKPLWKATVEEVDDEGDVSSSDSSGVRGARKGSEAKMDEDEHKQLGMCMFQCAEVGAEITLSWRDWGSFGIRGRGGGGGGVGVEDGG